MLQLTEPLLTTAEGEHLRALVEKQPSCLMRVAIDGVMLAVNEAALGLLGAADLAEVLGRSIATRLVPEDFDRWADFADRVWTHGAGSLECDLLDESGARRTALLQATAMRGHPDGIDSILVAARDISAPRRLERTLQDDEANRLSLEAARAQLEEATAEQQRLAALLADAEVGWQRTADALRQNETARLQLEADFAADSARLQARVDEQQLAVLERERDTRALLSELHARVAEAAAERTRLEAAIDQRSADLIQALGQQQALAKVVEQQEADRHHLEAELDRERARTATAVPVPQDRSETDREHQERLVDVQRQLAAARAEQQALAKVVEQQEADRHHLEAELDRERTATAVPIPQDRSETDREHQERLVDLQRQLAAALAEQQRLTHLLEQPEAHGQDRIATLQAQLTNAIDGQKRLQMLVAASEAQQMRLTAERVAERTHAEGVVGKAILERNRILKVLTDQQVELQHLAEHARSLESLAATGRLARGVGRELDDIVNEVERRAQYLLRLSALEAAYRHEVETLRVDAARAASLARQLTQLPDNPTHEVRLLNADNCEAAGESS